MNKRLFTFPTIVFLIFSSMGCFHVVNNTRVLGKRGEYLINSPSVNRNDRTLVAPWHMDEGSGVLYG